MSVSILRRHDLADFVSHQGRLVKGSGPRRHLYASPLSRILSLYKYRGAAKYEH